MSTDLTSAWDEGQPVTEDLWNAAKPEAQANADTDALIGQTFKESFAPGLDRRASILKLASTTGVPADTVEANYDGLRSTWEASQFDVAKWRSANPGLVDLIAKRPELGPVVVRDEKVSALTKALRFAQAAFSIGGGASAYLAGLGTQAEVQAGAVKRVATVDDPTAVEAQALEGAARLKVPYLVLRDSLQQTDVSEASFRVLMDKLEGRDSWESEKRLVDMESKLVPRYYGDGWEGFLNDAASVMGSQVETLKGTGAAGAALGLATLAVTGNPEAAVAAATLGGKAGATVASFVLETGSAYRDYRRLKTDDGRQVSDETAIGGALVYGAVASAIATASFGATLRSLGPAGEALASGGGKAEVARLMNDAGFRRLATRAAKAWLEAASTEGAEEFFQNVLQDVIGYLQKVGTAGAPQQADVAGSLEAGVEAARQAAAGSLITGGAQALAGQALTPVLRRLTTDASARSQSAVEAIQGVMDSKVPASALADLITRETAASGEAVTHLYVDPAAVAKLGVEAPVDPQTLQDALATGQKLEVPVAEYLDKWAPAVGDSLVAHMATRPGYLTASEQQAQETEIQAEAEQVAAAQVSEVAEVQSVVQDAVDRMGMRPLSPEAMGLEGEALQQYLADQVKAQSLAAKRAELAVQKDALRQKEAAWKEAHAAETTAADADYEALPARQAERFLRGVIDGEKSAPVKLDYAAVKEILGTQGARKILTTKDGTGADPRAVADLLDYPGGKLRDRTRAMLIDITQIPDKKGWVKQRADERMAERHPALIEDRARLRQVVEQGLHGEQSSGWLLKEIRALGAKAGAGRVRMEAIQRAARLMAERTKVGTLNVHRALQAERQAANRKAIAATKGNWGQALVYAQQQLLNMHLWREFDQARDQREAFLDLAADLKTPKAQGRMGKSAPIYRDGVAAVLEALGLKAPEQRETPLPTPEQIIGQMEADGATVMFDPDVLAQVPAKPRDYRELTVAQMREVTTALKNIQAASRSRATALVEGKRRDKLEVVAQLVEEAQKHLASRGPIASSLSARTAGQVLSDGWNAFDGALRKPQEFVLKLGGGDVSSLWYKAVAKPLQEAKAHEADLLRETVKPITDAFEKIPSEVRARFMERVDGKALFPNHRVDSDQQLAPPSRRFELLMLALNAGNESNLQRLTDGRNITIAEVENAISILSKEELDWVQSIWDAAESLKEPAFALEERDSGVRPEAVVARPLKTEHGNYRGGYFPAVYDRRVEVVGERQASQAVAAFQDPTFTRPGTSHGHLKARVENFSGAISLEPSTIMASLTQVAHDIAYREAIKSVGGLILNPEIQAVLKDRLGDGAARQMLPWLKDIGQMRGMDSAVHAGPLLKAVRAIRANTVTAVLGYSAQTALGDFSNILAAVPGSQLRTAHWAAGLTEFARHPLVTSRLAWEKSGELRTRRDSLNRELGRQVRKFTARGPFARGPLEWAKHYAFSFMEFSDWATATPIWVGAYRQAIADGRPESESVDFADATVQHLFPSHNTVDAAPILRDKGVIGMGMLFYGFFNTAYNVSANLLEAKRFGRFAAYITAIGAVSELLSGRGREQDEDWGEWFLRKTATTTLATVPVGGDLAALIDAKLAHRNFNPRSLSLSGYVTAFGAAAIDAFDGEKDAEKRLANLFRSVAPLTGVPLSQPMRTGGYISQLVDGSDVADPFDFAAGVVYGRRETQPASIPSTISDVIQGR